MHRSMPRRSTAPTSCRNSRHAAPQVIRGQGDLAGSQAGVADGAPRAGCAGMSYLWRRTLSRANTDRPVMRRESGSPAPTLAQTVNTQRANSRGCPILCGSSKAGPTIPSRFPTASRRSRSRRAPKPARANHTPQFWVGDAARYRAVVTIVRDWALAYHQLYHGIVLRGRVMKAFLLSLVTIYLSIHVFTAMASAQGIDPRCTAMRDKVGCTCAVQNGGNVAPYCPDRFNKGGWCYPRRALDGYVACMHRFGRK